MNPEEMIEQWNEIDFSRVDRVDLDKTEKEVIRLLQKDGRISFVDMAQAVGVTEGTIRRKFTRLMEEGVIKIAGVTNPFVIGFDAPTFIGINAEASRIEDIVDHLSSLDKVHFVATTTGIFDIIIQCHFPSNSDLYRFIVEDLGSIEGIKDSNTSLLLHIYKNSYEWGVAEEDRQ